MNPELSEEPSAVENEDGTLRLIVFGDPGVGKTTLALSFPRPLIINTDFGLEGDVLEAARAADAKVISPVSYKDLEALYFWLRDHSDEFDTIVIDTLDELVQTLLDEIVDEGKGEVDRKGRRSILDFVPEQGEYQANQRQMRRFLGALRRLKKHVVLVSAVRDGKSNGKRTVDVAPGQQSIVKRFASVMGELVVTPLETDGDDHRVLMTDPGSQRAECKTRYSALLPYVVEPTFASMWEAVLAARQAD